MSTHRLGRSRRSLVLVTAVAIVAAACSVSGSRRQATGSTPTTATGSTSSTGPSTTSPDVTTSTPTPDSLRWTDCDGSYQCATLRVPLDYARPDGPKLSLAIARRQATNTGERIGSLLINPGGPGGSAIELIENISLQAELTDRFDIVGFDPRGVGRSSPLDCHSHLQQMYDADPTLEDRADRARYLTVSRAYVAECRRKYMDVLPYLGTQNVARDMDEVRKALGDRQLNYVGFSYGTSIGQQYAHLFPTRIRAMVLDGVVETDVSGMQGAATQADGFERALGAFLKDCANQSSCELGPNPGKVVDRVIDAAEKHPIPAPDADRPATPGIVELGIGQALYAKQLWGQLAKALHEAAGGDGGGLVELADEYLQRRPDGSYPNLSEIYFAVSCLDSTWPRDADAVFAAAKRVGKKDPRLGEGLVNDYVRCALWPVRPKPLPKATAAGSPAILVISTTGDPATPYASGVAVARRLPKGVLLTNVGDGHTVFAQGKECVDTAVVEYLLKLDPPADGQRCE